MTFGVMHRMLQDRRLVLLFALFWAFPASPVLAQERAPHDSLRVAVDSLRAGSDSLRAAAPDTVRPIESPSGIDSVVTYSATDSVVYSLARKTMYLYGKGNIRYKELGLKSELIDINWDSATLHAEGVADSSDTTGNKFRGQPEMIDGNERYHGSEVSYNFRTKKGKIDLGKTEIEKGFYYGDEIKKMDDRTLFVADGRFTTCDLEHPHYYFYSPEMKIIVGDRVIARPVTLNIAGVPVFALPFGIFPTERGRRSGIIAPAYGESGTRGRYLTHLGYYLALNDYTDINFRTDLYAKGGYTLYSDFRYALRYYYTGGISGSYGRIINGEPGDPTYSNTQVFNAHLSHNQQFDPTTRLVVDFTFMSNSYYQQTSNNLNDLLLQNMVSNATLTKYWEGTPNSLTLNIRRDQNLQSGQTNDVLPSLSFSRNQSFPFRSNKSASSSSDQAWYELIGYTYNGQALNVRNKVPIGTTGDFSNDQRWGVQHSLPINASPKLGYFTVTPYFDYTEKWYGKSIVRGVNAADSVVTNDVTGFTAVRYFDMGVSASTKLYGIFQPGVFGITGIRHQMTPTISYIYQPDFSDPKFGYYGTYKDTSGVTYKYSRFEREVFGGAPSERRQAIAFRLGNVLEMKTASHDTSQQENKFQLLNLDLSTSYNFARDSLRFDEIAMSFRTSIGQWLDIGGSSSFNLYKFQVDPANPTVGRRVNTFLLSEGKFADMTSFSVSVGTRLSGEKKETSAGPVRSATDSIDMAARKGYVGLYDQELPDFSIPWNLDLTWNFSQNQQDPRYKFRSSTLSAALGFNLTEFWKITASTSYDLVYKQVSAPQITVYRDLHCWELNFSWVPTGVYRNFQVEIRLKAPQLRDVKVTKQGSARNIY
jgi:lipopolysaccharide assembly outer membrane protein LptD (OstA)